ncbi:MAG: ABC transporter ATP-binding protein [Candidatus Bathyarchaeia archaeon]
MVPKKEVITAIDLWKIYRLGRIDYPALRGVTLSVYEGEYIALVGPSGSGKSTLLNLFGALDRPTKGVVLIDGADISKLSDDRLAELRNKKLGFVFQNFNLIPYMTAEDNVELPLMASNIGIRERKRKAREVLAMVGLEGRESSRPSELSGGQQQRVAVARALVNDPKIILADEPTGNLDSKSSEEIIEILRMLNMNYGVSIVMVTHNLELTRYCHRIWYLRDGKIEREVVQNA